MKVWGPYKDRGAYRVRWQDGDDAKVESKSFQNEGEAKRYAVSLRREPRPARGKQSGAAKQLEATAQQLSGETATAEDILAVLMRQFWAVEQSGDDPLRVARTIAQLAGAARHYISVRDEEQRLAELEDGMHSMVEAQRQRAGAHQRTAVLGDREISSTGDPIH
jgi:hypothetical protein